MDAIKALFGSRQASVEVATSQPATPQTITPANWRGRVPRTASTGLASLLAPVSTNPSIVTRKPTFKAAVETVIKRRLGFAHIVWGYVCGHSDGDTCASV